MVSEKMLQCLLKDHSSLLQHDFRSFENCLYQLIKLRNNKTETKSDRTRNTSSQAIRHVLNKSTCLARLSHESKKENEHTQNVASNHLLHRKTVKSNRICIVIRTENSHVLCTPSAATDNLTQLRIKYVTKI